VDYGVSLSPSTGKVGTEVTVTVNTYLFPVNGDYVIQWSPEKTFDIDNTIIVEQGNMTSQGYIATNFVVPEAQYGTNYVQFIRIAGNNCIKLLFGIKPDVKFNPSPAEPGATIAISGTGLPANDHGVLYFDGKIANVIIATDESGNLATEFVLPPNTTIGMHDVIIYLAHLHMEDIVTTLDIVPVGSSSPEAKESESPRSEEVVTLPVTEPPDAPSKNVSEEIVLPEKPTTLAPRGQRIGIFGTSPVTFNWTGLSDSDEITYTLEIASKPDFSEISKKKTDLNQTSYTVDLDPGKYYWRIRAVDDVGNKSGWVTSLYSFRVGFSTWIFIAGIGVLLFVLILLSLTLIRNLREYRY